MLSGKFLIHMEFAFPNPLHRIRMRIIRHNRDFPLFRFFLTFSQSKKCLCFPPCQQFQSVSHSAQGILHRRRNYGARNNVMKLGKQHILFRLFHGFLWIRAKIQSRRMGNHFFREKHFIFQFPEFSLNLSLSGVTAGRPWIQIVFDYGKRVFFLFQFPEKCFRSGVYDLPVRYGLNHGVDLI